MPLGFRTAWPRLSLTSHAAQIKATDVLSNLKRLGSWRSSSRPISLAKPSMPAPCFHSTRLTIRSSCLLFAVVTVTSCGHFCNTACRSSVAAMGVTFFGEIDSQCPKQYRGHATITEKSVLRFIIRPSGAVADRSVGAPSYHPFRSLSKAASITGSGLPASCLASTATSGCRGLASRRTPLIVT